MLISIGLRVHAPAVGSSMAMYRVVMQLPSSRAMTTPPAVCITLYVILSHALTVPAFRATHAAPMLLVEIAGLQPRDGMLVQAPLFKKARGRPQVARLTAGEQRTRVAVFNGALQNIPDHLQHCCRCHQEGHNILRCRAQPADL